MFINCCIGRLIKKNTCIIIIYIFLHEMYCNSCLEGQGCEWVDAVEPLCKMYKYFSGQEGKFCYFDLTMDIEGKIVLINGRSLSSLHSHPSEIKVYI